MARVMRAAIHRGIKEDNTRHRTRLHNICNSPSWPKYDSILFIIPQPPHKGPQGLSTGYIPGCRCPSCRGMSPRPASSISRALCTIPLSLSHISWLYILSTSFPVSLAYSSSISLLTCKSSLSVREWS